MSVNQDDMHFSASYLRHHTPTPTGHMHLLPFLSEPISWSLFSAVSFNLGSSFLYSSSGTSCLCVHVELPSLVPAFPPSESNTTSQHNQTTRIWLLQAQEAAVNSLMNSTVTNSSILKCNK